MNIVKIELEGIREQVQMCLTDRMDEIKNKVAVQLTQTLTEEWVDEEIKKAVDIATKKAIGCLADDWKLKRMIQEIIADKLIDSQ